MKRSPIGTITLSSHIDEHGNPIKRTPYTHPYSYDGFVTYRGGKNEEVTGTVYSDRLLQWDYEKTRKLMKKHFKNSGDYYNDRTPKQIEAFLCDRLDKKVALVLVMQYCNQSSGYPVWRFDFKDREI